MKLAQFRHRTTRLLALALVVVLIAACGGNGDNGAAEPEESATDPAETGDEIEAEGDEAEEPEDDPSQRPDLYYPASELFLPDHPVDGFVVDFYASHQDVDTTIAWFEDNVENLNAFTIQDETVNANRLWIVERDDAPAGDVARIEIADSSAHADIGLMSSIADVLPPDTTIIAIAHE